MPTFRDVLEAHRRKMLAHGATDLAVRCAVANLKRSAAAEQGLLPEAEILPLPPPPTYESLDSSLEDLGRSALPHTLHVVLNGGLATGIGGTGPKALVEAAGSRTFLEILLSRPQAVEGRMLFMHSFATQGPCLEAISHLVGKDPEDGLGWDFRQHQVPKADPQSFMPVSWPKDPRREWCPPGHGNLYPAMWDRGLLQGFLGLGYRYAFVSNVDNLAAWPDPKILGFLISNRIPFLLEATRRTQADTKGGHLARARSGLVVLRERTQCPQEDLPAFQDIDRHQWFNTNNLWIDLHALARVLEAHEGVLPLPVLRNEKPLDPKDPSSPRALQLETAAGAAISLFSDAVVLAVPRSRFAPVKNLGDLLAIRSDAYEIGPDGVLRPKVWPPPVVELDPETFKTPKDLEAAFPEGPPSLSACRRLEVRGLVRFGKNVQVRGAVRVVGGRTEPLEIPAESLLTDEEPGPDPS